MGWLMGWVGLRLLSLASFFKSQLVALGRLPSLICSLRFQSVNHTTVLGLQLLPKKKSGAFGKRSLSFFKLMGTRL
jgi:hypothetical protein